MSEAVIFQHHPSIISTTSPCTSFIQPGIYILEVLIVKLEWQLSSNETAPRYHSMTGPLYREIALKNQAQIQASIDDGVLKPFTVFHFFIVYTSLPLAALLVPHGKGSKYAKLVIFAIILAIGVDDIKHRRMTFGANGYGIGLTTAWWILWCATLLIFSDAEREFKRIERRSPINVNPRGDSAVNSLNRKSPAKRANSSRTSRQDLGQFQGSTTNRETRASTKRRSEQQEYLVWQPYPQPFFHRVNWALSLVLNLRGPEWNWRSSKLSPLPQPIHAQLHPEHPDSSPGPENPIFLSTKTRFKAAVLNWIQTYLCLDLAKCLMMRDAYFWGDVSPPPPPPYPFHVLAGHPVLAWTYRIYLTMFGTCAALIHVNSYIGVIFLGISVASPRIPRALTSVPIDAPWLYPGLFGPFHMPLLDHGLAGFWSQFWHQLFRFGFTSSARFLLSLCSKRLASNSRFRRFVMAFVAFCLSGALHAAGSYTQYANTKPLSNTLLFFFLQAVGITVQTFLAKVVLPKMIPYRFPRWMRRATNFAFAFVWSIVSGPFLADDLARGGVWLTEPIAFSPLRGLGVISGAEKGWWCWHGRWFQYRREGSWWERGLQVL